MLADHLPSWVPILAALLTPTIAVAGIYIAWQQWRTNRNKLKFELFSKRYAFYEAAMEMIGTILTSGGATEDTTFRFLQGTRGAQFIVGSELAEYFDKQLYARAVELHGLEAELAALPQGPERTQNVKQQREIKNWLSSQRTVLDAKFAPLLKLSH